MLGYFPSASFCAFDTFCVILHFTLSAYPVCACVSAALILTPFCLPGSSRNNKHVAARASGLICQPAVLSDNLDFVCKLCVCCHQANFGNHSTLCRCLTKNLLMPFVLMFFYVSGPTRTSRPTWPPWSSGFCWNTRT